MKPFKSIKWRLQIWYGVILLLVLAGFGMTAYQLERGRQVRRLDDELHRRFTALAANLRRPPPRGDLGGQLGGLSERPDQEGRQGLPEGGPPDFQRRPPPFRLAAEYQSLFGTNDLNNSCYRIFHLGGENRQLIAQSDNFRPALEDVVEKESLEALSQFNQPRNKQPPPPLLFQTREDRVLLQLLPSRELVEVKCSLGPLQTELRGIALDFFLVGGLILLVGLAGGWWFVRRSLQPISAIQRRDH